MLDAVERFATAYQHTITMFGALGTVSAVIVSLFIALLSARSTRTRLKASANLLFIVHETVDPKNRPGFLTVSIANTGNMPLRIPFAFFTWKVPFTRHYMLVNPMDGYGGHKWIPQKQYPVEIKPRASETFYVSDEAVLHAEVKRMRQDARGVSRLLFSFMKANVHTDDGRRFRVKLDNQVRKVWA